MLNRITNTENCNTPCRLVLTGGPCAGKTTAMHRLQYRLESLGWQVCLSPEAATLMATGGMRLHGAPQEVRVRNQTNILQVIFALEDAFCETARSLGGPCVVLCDRGAMDAAAYMPDGAWEELLRGRGWRHEELRDGRYDAVLHLVTAAMGAESFYTLENNDARGESLHEAIAIDQRIEALWRPHPQFHCIDNRDGLEEKLLRAERAACQAVGATPPGEASTVFELASALPEQEFGATTAEFSLRQFFLLSEEPFPASLRRRERMLHDPAHGAARAAPVHIHRVPLLRQERILALIEQPITGREFAASQRQANPGFAPLNWRRRCFLWDGQLCELDQFETPRPGRCVLRVFHSPREPPTPPWPGSKLTSYEDEEALLRAIAAER